MRSPTAFHTLPGMEVWESPNPDYSLLSQVVIDKDQKKLLASESCEEEDCNWGWTELVPSTGGFVARYQTAGLTYELYVREITEDEIQLFITTGTSQQSRILLSLDRFRRK